MMKCGKILVWQFSKRLPNRQLLILHRNFYSYGTPFISKSLCACNFVFVTFANDEL